MKHVCRSIAVLVALGGSTACPVRAEVFVLHSGGEVHGELLNRNESPRTTYQVKTPSGGQVTLEAEQVKKVTRQNAAEVKYDQTRGTYPDTVEGQWKLAEWCRENRLLKQRRMHLERVVELDPNHAAARRGLGFTQVHGRWVTQETLMTENGYLRYKGAWVLPQEIDIKEQERKEKLAQLDWANKLKRWSRWLDTDKADQAIAGIKAIDDPFAAGALARHLNDPKSPEPRSTRLLYVSALGRLQAGAGMNALITASLYDPDEEIRLSSMEQVVDHRYRPAVGKYVQALKNKDNAIVNRAASCLGQLKDPASIGPLIDALVTVHTYEIQRGQPGQTSASFGRGPGGGGGGGFSFGGSGPEIVKQQVQNQAALSALVALTGTSFNFDESAWKKWYAAQKQSTSLDSRRDGASQ